MAASIFNGNYIKLLKDQLKLNDTVEILTGSGSPESSKDAHRGSIYLRTDTGAIYKKTTTIGTLTGWSDVTPTGFATVALDNLAFTAVNVDIKPGVNDTIKSGTTGNQWSEVHTQTVVNDNVAGAKDLNLSSAAGDIFIHSTTAGKGVYVDNGTELRIKTNGKYVGVTTPAGMGADYSIVLPAAQGGVDQVLKNDGSGNLGWVTPSTGVTAHSALTQLDYATAGHTGFEPTVTKGDLTGAANRISVTGGSASIIGTGVSVDINTSLLPQPLSADVNKALIVTGLNTATWQDLPSGITDHSLLSNLSYATSNHTGFEPTVTKGNLTETTSSVLTISNGTNSVIGSGTTIEVSSASSISAGYLTSADWSTFNSKEPAQSKGAISELTSSVLTIANGSNSTVGPNVQITVHSASSLSAGYLTSADWTTFNSKEPAVTKGDLTETSSSILTITGGTGSVIGSGTTIAVSSASTISAGYLSSADFTTFNDKVTSNGAIVGATKTKITYDAKGLVTAGADATIADFSGTAANRIPYENAANSALEDSASLTYTDATKTLKIGLESVSTGILALGNASSGNLTKIQAASASSAVTYTLPGADATISGQALTSNASGALSWTTVGGTFITAIAGENLTAGDAAYISKGAGGGDSGRTTGLLYKLDPTNDARMDFCGFVVTTVLATASATASCDGYATPTGGGSYTIGSLVYGNITTPGSTTQTAPSAATQWIIPLGTAISTTQIVINASLSSDAIYIEQPDPESFSITNNTSVAADVTGMAFTNASNRGGQFIASIYINATSSLYETIVVNCIQRAADWQLAQNGVGDSSGIVFSITTLGQIQYTCSNYSGFVSGKIVWKKTATGI